MQCIKICNHTCICNPVWQGHVSMTVLTPGCLYIQENRLLRNPTAAGARIIDDQSLALERWIFKAYVYVIEQDTKSPPASIQCSYIKFSFWS